MEAEIWKPVVGFEGYYEVSNLGRVRSLERPGARIRRSYGGKIVKPTDAGQTYRSHCFCVNGKHYMRRLCRVVAEAFIPNPDNLPQVNHKDEDKTNDRADNLEWCDAKYNTNYGTGISRRKAKICKPVSQYKDGVFIRRFGSLNDAAKEVGVCPESIGKCCKGKVKRIRGYEWRFADV